MQIRTLGVRTGEVLIRELLPGIHLAGELRVAVFPAHSKLVVD